MPGTASPRSARRRNVTGHDADLPGRGDGAEPAATITVSATTFTVAANGTVTLNITVRATRRGQFFGQVRLVPTTSGTGLPTLHLPVVFRR